MASIDNLLQKLFIYVPDEQIEDFIENHTGTEVTSNDDFYKKINLLGSTGEFVAYGKKYAVNSASGVTTLNNLLGTTLSGTGAATENATTVIEFIQAVYTIATNNRTAIGNNSSGIIKRLSDLETSVDTSTTGLLDRTTVVEGKVITLVGDDTSKSVRTVAAEEVAKIVASADSRYDTLKEIADWILSDSTGAAKMSSDIADLKTKVGNENVSTQISTAITNAINDLDVTESTQSATGTIQNNGIFVVSGVTLGETDGKISGFTVTSIEVEQAGAAATVKSQLEGNASTDTTESLTLHGIKKYIDNKVSSKNVSAESSYISLITASASNNKVTVGVTNELKSAIDKANSAIQSIQYTTTNQTYISVSGAVDRVNVGDVTLEVTPNIGTLSSLNNEFTYTDGIASTAIVANLLNSIQLWGEYTGSSNS